MTAVQEHAPPPPAASTSPAGILLAEDVARIWSRVAGRPIKASTVRSYIKESKPMVGSKPGRYADNPMPAPNHMWPATTAWWPADQEAELIAWFKSRPTQSHGKGRQAFRKGS